MGTLNSMYDGSVVNGYLELEVSPDGTRRVIEQWSERDHPGMPYRTPNWQEASTGSSGDERQRQGAAKGREKGVKTNKKSGSDTAACNCRLHRQDERQPDRSWIRKPPPNWGYESTVARHLRAINKQK